MQTKLAGFILAFCLAACSSVYYSVWEKLGKEKRDLLRDNVSAAREEQEAMGEELASALDRLKQAYGTGGGRVEEMYITVKEDYDRSSNRASALHRRIEKVESIGEDLFDEWEREIGEMSSSELKQRSEEKLQRTKDRFEKLQKQMRRADESTEPVLSKLKDQMLYLKHSLNSQAVGHLEESEVREIENGIRELTQELNRSIARADEFIGSLTE